MSSRHSSKVSSVTQSPTLSTPSARPSLPSTLSTPSSDKAALCTVSVVKRFSSQQQTLHTHDFLIFMVRHILLTTTPHHIDIMNDKVLVEMRLVWTTHGGFRDVFIYLCKAGFDLYHRSVLGDLGSRWAGYYYMEDTK